MALPSLPAKGSDDWYAHYAALDADVRAAPNTYVASVGGGRITGPTAFPGPLNVTNDETWDITDLPEPIGHFTSALASRFVNPDPPDVASGGLVNAAVVTQVEGAAGANPTNRLFLDALLVRLGLKSYDDSAITTFAGATGFELDIAIDGASNNVQSIKGVYVVPIAGQLLGSGQPVSGTVDSLILIESDTLQTGYVDGTFLHFGEVIGVKAGRPIDDPLNITYNVQYSLLAERGQLFYTRQSENLAWFGISDDTDNTKVIWLRINATSGGLEFCKTDGTVLATLSNAGNLTVKSLAVTNETWKGGLTSPPISGTVYQNTAGARIETSVAYTPGAAAGSVTVELSQDGTTWRTWLVQSFAASAPASHVTFTVPVNWRYRLTVAGAGAALGALNAFG